MAVLVLSPHFDDAVLSCWHLLTGEEPARVINVFTGEPPAGRTGWWDVLGGASDSAERVRERSAEDRAALKLAGADAANLDLLDEQYRAPGEPIGRLDELLASHVETGDRIYAPAGIGALVDHTAVRDAALALREKGLPVSLYADLPHAVVYGLPSWLNGGDPDPYVDAAAFWTFALESAGVTDAVRPDVQHLDTDTRSRKLAAVREYRTQYALLAVRHPAAMSAERLAYEVTWDVP